MLNDCDGLYGGVALFEVNGTNHGSMTVTPMGITSVLVTPVVEEEEDDLSVVTATADTVVAAVNSERESSDVVDEALTGGQTGRANF